MVYAARPANLFAHLEFIQRFSVRTLALYSALRPKNSIGIRVRFF